MDEWYDSTRYFEDFGPNDAQIEHEAGIASRGECATVKTYTHIGTETLGPAALVHYYQDAEGAIYVNESGAFRRVQMSTADVARLKAGLPQWWQERQEVA